MFIDVNVIYLTYVSIKKNTTRRVSFSDNVVEVKFEVEEAEDDKNETEQPNTTGILVFCIFNYLMRSAEKEGDFLKKAHKLQDEETAHEDPKVLVVFFCFVLFQQSLFDCIASEEKTKTKKKKSRIE